MDVPDFLRAAAAHPPGDRVELPVHELCARCGHKVRTYAAVEAIRELLAAAGLRTDPDFADADRDEAVRLVPLAHTAETAPAEPEPEASEEDGFGLPQIAPKVGNLASAHRDLVSVRPDATVDYAMGLLFKHGHRQLPIISAPSICHGMVTWESIAQYAYGQPDAPVSHCRTPHETAGIDEDLFAVLARVTGARCAFVQDVNGIYCGLITARDVMGYLRNILEPFYVIGEIERRIRRHLNERFTEEDRERYGDPDHFMFGKYCDILRSPDRFARLGWPTNRPLFLDQLDRVRRIRNAVMHFDGEELPPADIRALKNFRIWIAALSPGY